MKVDNTELTQYNLLGKVKDIFSHILPDAVELLDHESVRLTTRTPRWDKNHAVIDGEKVYFRTGGIDVTVHADTVNYSVGHKITFGVRTDNDGTIDLGTLAEKFAVRWDEIKDLIDLHDNNNRKREENSLKRRANSEIVDKMKEDGLIEHIYEVTETSTGFRVELNLKNEDELRSYLTFKNDLVSKREVTA